MKEFFSAPDNNKGLLYMKYRNFMVEAYEKNQKRYFVDNLDICQK